VKNHVTVVGIIRIGLSVLGFAFASMIAVILVGVGIGVWYDGSEEVLPILSAVALSVMIAAMALTIPGIVAGIGVLRHKNWARYLSIALSVLDLLAPPIGTALAIYSIWVLANRRTVALFAAD
jgi:hypothetical protein